MSKIILRSGHLDLAAGSIVIAMLSATPGNAGCYEDIGCSDRDLMPMEDLLEISCGNLWHVRNDIYDDNGYCFQTERGRAAFHNYDCTFDIMGDVPLNDIERRNVEAIAAAEAEKSCE